MSAPADLLALAARDWRLLPVKPGGKTPLTRHGVKDASSDPAVISAWHERCPDANWAIATGLPGPQVLDVDDLQGARPVLARLDRLDAPQVATARGFHVYFAGQDRGTVSLGYGELRGHGSYVLCPPSIHPSGKEYVWLLAPSGRLPVVPAFIAANGQTAGCGEHQAPATGRLIPFGERHLYLRDFAVRLARAGITDQRRMLVHLQAEFEFSCEPHPAPARGALEALARWAARSRIAGRERDWATNGSPMLGLRRSG